MRPSGEDRHSLRRAERAVARLSGVERDVFLAIRVDDLSYPEIAERFGMSIAEVEQHFAASLDMLLKVMDEKDPWWWKFWRW